MAKKPLNINKKRIRLLRSGYESRGPVIYWMSRDQRADDNWALLFSQELALKAKCPLYVVFCLVPFFMGASRRHYFFMLEGLSEVKKVLEHKNIPFFLIKGDPGTHIPRFLSRHRCRSLVCEQDPLKIKRKWKEEISSKIDAPFYEVDAHNIVPSWVSSTKREYGAYTLRTKIQRCLPEFLEDFPVLKKHPYNGSQDNKKLKTERILKSIGVDNQVREIKGIEAGCSSAKVSMKDFISEKLENYDKTRNDPSLSGQSGLSPYIHFGQLSSQRIALEIKKTPLPKNITEPFLDELIIRKELAENFCYYSEHYDSPDCMPEWARKTLSEHSRDKREYVYDIVALERAQTHDKLWNAAQTEMILTGRMHGYMRMYWAKKILEWSKDISTAFKTAIELNDRYELDGRAPNGYAGIAWALGGVHDRAWPERSVFGKVRYMNYEGCRRKFDVEAYIKKVKLYEAFNGTK